MSTNAVVMLFMNPDLETKGQIRVTPGRRSHVEIEVSNTLGDDVPQIKPDPDALQTVVFPTAPDQVPAET
ncbi:MAG: hypothetical protein WCA85_29935 [Paraburkholderia sp.]|uniref:hypothetical protein n=1 Tax=Paraburkholderia sp. TaxID=1926495 RepID=UPI003C46FD4C